MNDVPKDETAGSPPEAGGRALVRVTVNLVPRAVTALDATCERTQDTKTDVVNRALVTFDKITKRQEQGYDLFFRNADGHEIQVEFVY
jgi:hypothetical protein